MLDTYRNDSGAGVAVFEKAVPATYDESWTRDPKAGRTAWWPGGSLSVHSSRTPRSPQTTLGGHPAWRVTAS